MNKEKYKNDTNYKEGYDSGVHDGKYRRYYEVSKETPNARGSGSTFDYVTRADSFEEARRLLLKNERNRLEQITITNGKREVWIWHDGRWETTPWN